MYRIKKNTIDVKEISKFLDVEYSGDNFQINTISSLNDPKDNSILFFSEKINSKFNFSDNVKYELKNLENFKKIILIAKTGIRDKLNIPIIESNNPRHDFYRVIMEYFAENRFDSGIHETAVIEKDVKIGDNVYIGPHCFIDKNVEIEDNVKILSNVSIYGETKIGKNSVIQSNTTIGAEGFSFSFNEDEFVHFAHLGSIRIGNNVWIGSNTTIEKAQIDQTIIEDNVNIDDHVTIGHNARIGEFSQITVGSIVAGRARIGKGCWISPNSVVDNGFQIGNNCVVGSGSLVRTNFPDNCVIFGSPAKLIRKN